MFRFLLFLALIPGKYVTYEQFGAVGDGIHDDQAAIIAAHAAANEQGLPVKANDHATYYIGNGTESAIIETDVDFGKAHFVIDDTHLMDIRKSLFIVRSSQQPIHPQGVTTLQRGQTNIGVTLPCRCLVNVVDTSRKVYIRYGLNQNDGTSTEEVFIAEKDGTVDAKGPIVWDYANITSITAYPIDKKRLTIKGGIFTTIANQAESRYDYHSRNIVINRSNVLVDGLTHFVEGEQDHGAPYSGFVSVERAAEVVVRNCLLTPHKTYRTIGSAGKPVSMGSYDIQATRTIDMLLKNCRQTRDIDDSTYWGLFASNFCKDLQMKGCVISRFDAHMGVTNIHLEDCIFGYMGVQMVGFGDMIIKGCEIHTSNLVSLRDDYGSSWEGDIFVKNCRIVPLAMRSGVVTILSGYNPGTHDFGYECKLPRSIVIDGLTVESGNAKADDVPVIFSSFGRDVSVPGLLPYDVPEKVVMRHVKVAGDKQFQLSTNPEMFRSVELIYK